jgi:hypothetical protein
VAGDKHDAVADQLVRDSHRLIREASVVTNNEPDILAEDTSLRIDVSHCQFSPSMLLFAIPCKLSGYRTSDPNQYLSVGGRSKGSRHDDSRQGQDFGDDHNLAPSPTIP